MGQYCWRHLAHIKGLRIAKSSIGLFAARTLAPGTDIPYTGDLRDLNAPEDGGTYYFQLSRGRAVDAARKNAGEGRWVNDPRGSGKDANAEWVVHTPPGGERRALIRIVSRVEKGEEILVAYGADYWRSKTKAKAKAKRQRKRKAAMPVQYGFKTVQRPAQQLATATIAYPSSDMIERIKDAARADAAYAALVEKPPADHEAHGALLWQGDCLVVPNDAALRTELLAECHDSITGAHFGRDKTLPAMKERFAWDGMATAVAETSRPATPASATSPAS